MNYDYWYALLPISRKKRLFFWEQFGESGKLYHMSDAQRASLGLFSEKELALIRQSTADTNVCSEQLLKKQGIHLAMYWSDDFPQRLRRIPDPPACIFYRGTLPEEERKSVAVVGARMCSEYGREIASTIGKKLAKHNVAVISGLALGIDSAAQAGALSADGMTYAVLGGGCDICYPASSRNLYRNILSGHGAVLSEYPPGTQPRPYYFPERNRIISGLSDVVVIVEAKKRSGSLITADCALDQNIDVFAVPGRIGDLRSEGCNQLIAQGAGILCDLDSLIEVLGFAASYGTDYVRNLPELTDVQQQVYDLLDTFPKNISTILDETELCLHDLLQILNVLQEKGLIHEPIRNNYSRRIIE